ncbi:MAG: class F sortase [Patescibacteria group bacterium]|nr:class F sortase [Patescibacteria group bacterium]MDE2172571.1 class F sortase [Patescibacteria group bacterium]
MPANDHARHTSTNGRSDAPVFGRLAAVAAVLVAVAVIITTLVRSLWYVPSDNSGLPPPHAHNTGVTAATSTYASSTSGHAPSVAEAAPVKLLIPSLNIDARVQDIGLTAHGTLGTPNNFVDVGWYKYGPAPGEIGSAVIDGHVDNGLSLPGVFKNLSNLKLGDDIYVTTADGSLVHFVTSKVDSYVYTDASTNEIFNQNDGRYLKLITCSGEWVAASRTYDHRLVITAVAAST